MSFVSGRINVYFVQTETLAVFNSIPVIEFITWVSFSLSACLLLFIINSRAHSFRIEPQT